MRDHTGRADHNVLRTMTIRPSGEKKVPHRSKGPKVVLGISTPENRWRATLVPLDRESASPRIMRMPAAAHSVTSVIRLREQYRVRASVRSVLGGTPRLRQGPS